MVGNVIGSTKREATIGLKYREKRNTCRKKGYQSNRDATYVGGRRLPRVDRGVILSLSNTLCFVKLEVSVWWLSGGGELACEMKHT